MLPLLRIALRSLALSLSLFSFQHLTLVSAQTYNYDVDIIALTRRENPAAPITVGQLPLTANGTVPFRPEIREMISDRFQWDLFILALSMFQYVGQNDSTSWYQIAGIHGVPFQTWNNVQSAPGANQSGYCTHSSILFPTWHRPYLALYEQEMYRTVNVIANLFQNVTERRLYMKAARDFRVPFWDWAISPPVGESYFPRVLWDNVVAQYGPNGVQNIKNPLYSYEFDPLDTDTMIWAPLKYWHETKRAPNTDVSIESPPSNNSMINEVMLNKLPEIQQRLFILFASYKDWNSFSNKAWAEERNASWLDSIEAIHDVIHIYGGYRGHMTYVPLSAFDPLFFLHHTMTDRLVAMWQVLNPTSWMTPMPSGETSFNAVQGSLQDPQTPLTPFLIDENGDFWNSDMARSTEAFGYTYADISAPVGSLNSDQKTLSQKIAKWYGGHSPASMVNKEGPERPPWQQQQNWKIQNHDFQPNVRPDALDPPASLIVDRGTYREWIVTVKVNVGALDGRFDIYFFIGHVPSDTSSWETARNQVGTVGIFAMNQSIESHTKISGTLPLTSSLMKMVAAGEIPPHLETDAVEPFLASMLNFRILGSDKAEVQSSNVDGLSISVISSQVQLQDDTRDLPSFSPAQVSFDVWP